MKSKKKPMLRGKVPTEILKKTIFRHVGAENDLVVLGPRIGEDAAVLRIGEKYLVVSTDPITAARKEVGWLAVHISANDVSVCGARPMWFLSDILLPEDSTLEDVEVISKKMDDAAKRLGIAIVGGHTEVTPGIEQVIVVGIAMGVTSRYITTGGGESGDKIILSKGIGLEGTSILAAMFQEDLSVKLPRGIVEEAIAMRERISVVPEALTLSKYEWVTSMHDPTEGGLFLGLHELADASNMGMQIYEKNLFVPEPTSLICKMMGVDPFSLLSSGALLATIKKDYVQEALSVLSEISVPARVIGELQGSKDRTLVKKDGTVGALPRPESDEIWRLVSQQSP